MAVLSRIKRVGVTSSGTPPPKLPSDGDDLVLNLRTKPAPKLPQCTSTSRIEQSVVGASAWSTLRRSSGLRRPTIVTAAGIALTFDDDVRLSLAPSLAHHRARRLRIKHIPTLCDLNIAFATIYLPQVKVTGWRVSGGNDSEGHCVPNYTAC